MCFFFPPEVREGPLVNAFVSPPFQILPDLTLPGVQFKK